MITTTKMEQNNLLLKVIGLIAVVAVIITSVVLFRETKIAVHVEIPSQAGTLGAYSEGTVSTYTSPHNLFTGAVHASTTVDVTGASILYGTTTVAKSYDGFMAYGAWTTTATGTAQLSVQNTGGDAICSAGAGGVVYATSTSNGAYTPSVTYAIGTSTSSTGYSTNFMAS